MDGYIPVEKISPLPSISAERPRPKSRKEHCASGVVLTGTQHMESLNWPFGSSIEKENVSKNKICGSKEAKVIRC
jgi:hypothetical protein